MSQKYPEYKGLNLPTVAQQVLEMWKEKKIFQQSIDTRAGKKPFVFVEGPPSANGLPGIHHVTGRAIKDIFCRYKTLKGFEVKRKAGWDTHGLPVELKVEKELGITKEDIGNKISVEDYNKACREAVMRYTDIWNDLTVKMGYWVDMENPYVTYESKYMESVWWLLGEMYRKDFMYKGYTIQPYSPKAGTGLSSHEINQPGCYKNVKDTSCVAQFKVIRNETSEKLYLRQNESFAGTEDWTNVYILAWTTTPWTLPSNTALTVGSKISYLIVKCFNQYTNDPMIVISSKEFIKKHYAKLLGNNEPTIGYQSFNASENGDYKSGGQKYSFEIIGNCLGTDLVGIKYEQLLPYTLPYQDAEKAFVIIPGDFVTTEDGTGIVHTAPTFGADDAFVAKLAGVPPMLILDENNIPVPLVDLRGRFRKEVQDSVFGLGGEYVKAEYLEEGEAEIELKKQRKNLHHIIADLKAYMSVDERITLKLKIENKAFKIEKYEHNYPHY